MNTRLVFLLCALLLQLLCHVGEVSGYAYVTLLVDHPILGKNVTYMAEMAAFGPAVKAAGITGPLFLANPPDACSRVTPPLSLSNSTSVNGTTTHGLPPWVALVLRGECNFEDKVVRAQDAGAVFVIVYNNVATLGNALVTMSPGASGGAAVKVPAAFVSKDAGLDLIEVGRKLAPNGIPVKITTDDDSGSTSLDNHWAIIVFVGILAILISSFFIMIFLIVEIYRQRRRRHRRRPKPVPVQVVITLPTKEIAEGDLGEDKNVTCAICLDDFEVGTTVRQLPCNHQFHIDCVDPWLMKHNRFCPVCKMDIEKGIELRKLEEDGRLGEVIEMQDMSRPSTSTAYSQRDSGDIEEGGVRSSMAVTPFETIHEEPATSGPHEEEAQTAPSVPPKEVHIPVEEPESQMKQTSSASHLVDEDDEEEGATPLADRRRGLLSFLKGKAPEVGGSRIPDSSSEDVTI